MVTLVMALVLTYVWMKSLIESNCIDLIKTACQCDRLISTKGCILWESFQSDIPAHYFSTTLQNVHFSDEKIDQAFKSGLACVCVDEQAKNYCEIRFFFTPEALPKSHTLFAAKGDTVHLPEWQGQWCGFGHGNWKGWATLSIASIPYWSLVLLLTLLSAYLLLSKPRKATPKKIVEPITDEGK